MNRLAKQDSFYHRLRKSYVIIADQNVYHTSSYCNMLANSKMILCFQNSKSSVFVNTVRYIFYIYHKRGICARLPHEQKASGLYTNYYTSTQGVGRCMVYEFAHASTA